MQQLNALIVYWMKRTEESGWTIRVELPAGTLVDIPIGGRGAVPAGTVLSSLIKEINAIPAEYPFQYDMTTIQNTQARTIQLKFMGERPAHAEISISAMLYIKDNMFQTNWVSAVERIDSPEELAFYELQSDSYPQLRMMTLTTNSETEVVFEKSDRENRFWLFIDPTDIEVIDGDTIAGYIMGYAWPSGKVIPNKVGDYRLKEYDQKVHIRYLGIDTFELSSSNSAKSKLYNVSTGVLDSAAKEAKNMNQAILDSTTGIIAVSLQYNQYDDVPIPDDVSRLIGVIYATNYTSYQEAASALQENVFQGINVNKELLKPMYSKYQQVKEQTPNSVAVPLAEFTGNRFSGNQFGINVSNWAAELNLSLPPDKNTVKNLESILNEDKATADKIESAVKDRKTYVFKGNSRKEVKRSGYTNNDLSFVKPLDDRLLDGKIYGPTANQETDAPWDYSHRVRIGDVFLPIPPLAIRMDKQYLTENVSTLRSKSSLQKNIGNTRNIISMDLYFSSDEDINGIESIGYYTDKKGQIPYYMDGLRPLIAQFKKAPFLPIDNEYVNESLGVHNVALRNLQVETVPNFPEAIKATLILEEFDAKPYLVGEQALGDLINYPLLRWHYQRLLHKPDIYEPWRTYLPEIQHLDNHVTFSILNEDQLRQRKLAIQEFRDKQTPSEFERQITDLDTDYGKQNSDAKNIMEVVEQYERFMKEWKDKTILKKHGYDTVYDSIREVPSVSGESLGWDNGLNLLNGLSFKETALGKEIAILLYGEDPSNPGQSIKKPYAHAGLIAKAISTPANVFYPHRSLSSGTHVYGDDKYRYQYLTAPGFFQIYLSHPKNKEKFAAYKVDALHFFDSRDGESESELFFIPATDAYAAMDGSDGSEEKIGGQALSNLMSIAKDFGNDGQKLNYRLDSYEKEYNALATEINRTEENMSMEKYDIPNMTPVSLTVAMENNFSTQQVQSAQTPTMQFFGAIDPEIMLTFETTDEGVQELEHMLRKVGQYVKEYREGLVSGFMGITNPLVQLFGITTVMPRNVQYDTVSGHPDRKVVTLTCSAFDKSQRRQEALYGYLGGDSQETLRDRAYDNYDPGKDSMYVHERMRQMELYPDLEMAKVSELNEALPYLNADLAEWENRTNQVFLDPDFYVSTKSTFRNFLKDVLDTNEDITFRWEDVQGYIADSSLKESNPLKFTDSSKTEAEFEQEAKETPYADPTLLWEGHSEEEAMTLQEKNTSTVETDIKTGQPEVDFKSSDVLAFVKQSQSLPTTKEWLSWPGNGKKNNSDYLKWIASLDSEIDAFQLWQHLALTVFDKFANSNLALIRDEKTNITKGKIQLANAPNMEHSYRRGEKYGDLAWLSADDFFNNQIDGIIWKKKNLKNGKQASKENIGYLQGVSNRFANENTYSFQRILSYLRALMKVESGGRQTNGKSALLYDKNSDGIPTKAGIMGAKLTNANSQIEAQRMIWDWRYNIEQVVGELVEVFQKAEQSDYEEIFVQRMDWAIASRSWSELPKILDTDSKDDDTATAFLGGPINPERDSFYQRVLQSREREVSYARGDVAPPLYFDLYERIIPKAYALYNKLSYLSESSSSDNQQYLNELVASREAKIESNVPIGSQEDRLKGMFTDMYEYDHTGRLLRAFPSFSMQLIDEGKWYNNFRTWDNFYGYNALHSIDVYKSRKIAADTAVIQMSNMYGGLTSKSKDMEYLDLVLPSFFSSQFWENYVLGIPTEELLEARKDIFKTMMLEAGARVHLRMGYGADARTLPVVFNGVISEVESGDVVTITAQGDGVELTNTISGNPKDENTRGLFNKVVEPRDFIGQLLTSKGNWLKDMVSDLSDGEFFKDSPLGIAHFGSPISAPQGTWNPFSEEFGEAMQNVYSQNGMGEKSQWMKENGESVGEIRRLISQLFTSDILNAAGDNDEDNIAVKLYGNTPWDLIQTFALATHDYTAAVFPFQFRSSLFFGRPHWPVVYDYDTTYSYDEETTAWRKEITNLHRKTFSQAHFATSDYNLICNDMKVSAEGVFNNVVVEYDGHVTPPLQADNDIRFDQQRTAHVQANIVASGFTDFWTSEEQASRYGHSTVRDFMKDIYKGSYTITGDATIKPHDSMYLSDVVQDIQGIHLVKAVHHTMSLETGFVSIVEPDAYTINFDLEGIFLADKVFSVMKNLNGRILLSGLTGLSSFMFAGSISRKLLVHVSDIMDKWVVPAGSFIYDNFLEKIIKKGTVTQYKVVAHYLQDEQMLASIKQLGSKTAVDDIIIDTLKARTEYLSSQWRLRKSDAYKLAKKNYKSSKPGILSQTKQFFHIDDVAGTEMLLDNMKQAATVYDDVRDARKTANRAKMISTVRKTADVTQTTLRKSASLVKNVLSKPFVWGIIFEVALEVITSTLIEMWTRRKQNAECIKMFPLKYKGKPWVAAMTGHRGSVWGDTPSLRDRLWHATFQNADTDDQGVLFFVFKTINFLGGADSIGQQVYEANKQASKQN